MTRLTPVQPEQTKDSVKGTLDELAARGSALGPMVIAAHSDAARALRLSDRRQRCLSAA
jgi:hypothetical protein